MEIYVKRESETTRSRFVTPTYIDREGNQIVTGAEHPVVTEDVNHYRLHEGRAFYMYENRKNGTPLVDDGYITFAIASGSGTRMHMTIGGICGGDGEIQLYEGSTVTGGTAKTAIARSRQGSITSDTAILLDPTITTLGTQLFEELVAGGVKKRAGGGSGESSQFLLAPLTTYIIRLQNVSGSSQYATLELEWYE